MITVITPTYRDWQGLRRAIGSLDGQAFDDWQHVIVADGPDPTLRRRLGRLGYGRAGKRVFAELGRNWHQMYGGDSQPQDPSMPGVRGGRGSRGAIPALVGSYLAAGEFIGYLDQDCEYTPDHLKLHEATLYATPDAGFSFSRMRRYLDGRFWDEIGDGYPAHGRVDCNAVVHKAELFTQANWRRGGDSDYDMLGRWQGVKYAYIPYTTVNWHHSAADI